MEAPAPASALIHSATLVSAGIYLILRFNHLIELSTIMTNTILIISTTTASFGALTAANQTDLKKILAFSTISHCGFMMTGAVLKQTDITLFYLFVHGCSKATAFMCVGNILHNSNNIQDFRKLGGLFNKFPFEFYMLSLCLLTLGGFPGTFGYCAKHFILKTLSTKSTFVYYYCVGMLM
jgi:NADH:ubiquinone oxidoreductase subunit 5 (subunit L)/multisubunit Na+/H+ antiporter MnhA subunit